MADQRAVYDASYIALADRTGYPLVTIDQPQMNAAIAEGVSVIPITHFQP